MNISVHRQISGSTERLSLMNQVNSRFSFNLISLREDGARSTVGIRMYCTRTTKNNNSNQDNKQFLGTVQLLGCGLY